MSRRPRTLASLAAASGAAALLSAPLAAQDGSFLQNLPSAFIVDEVNPLGTGSKFDINSPFSGELVPFEPSPDANVPVFSLQEMFPEHYHWMHIDAMSTGNDIVPVEMVGGVPRIEPNVVEAWVALNFSLRSGVTGAPNSKIDQYVQVHGPAASGAAVFSYHFPGSALPDALLNRIFIEHGPGTPSGVPADPSNPADVVAFDTFVQAIANADGQGQPLFPNTKFFFFSLSRESVETLNFQIQETDLQPLASDTTELHEASIYMIQWVNNAWTQPVTQFDYRDLAVPGLVGDENENGDLDDDYADIDAIGVYVSDQSIRNDGRLVESPQLFYSFRREEVSLYPWPEIMFLPRSTLPNFPPGGSAPSTPVDLGGPNPPSPPNRVENGNGIDLETLFDIDIDDDIDAICFNDPELGSNSIGFSSPIEDETTVGPMSAGYEIQLSLCATPPRARALAYAEQNVAVVVSGQFSASPTSPSVVHLQYRVPETRVWNPLQVPSLQVSTSEGAARYNLPIALPFGSGTLGLQVRAAVFSVDNSRAPLVTYPVEIEL
ncbi:MAG: hypothetical protein AAF196_11830 [Planctomycetota bacterium]